MKLQIEGKGGIHQEYERTIKTFQKNEEELTAELARHKAEVERNIFKVKEMTERVRIL